MRNARARLAAVGVVTLALGAAALGGLLPSAIATSGVVSDRLAGANRYDTARVIGDDQPDNNHFAFAAATQAVIVSGDTFPDALSAAYLAGAYGGPTFLTAHDVLSTEAVQGIQDLGIKKVTIVGGNFAVTAQVDAALAANGIASNRIAGDTRDATAAMVAESGGAIGTYGGVGATAILAADSVDHYVDALAAGPLAWAGHLPMLLTPTATLAPEAQAALAALKIKHVVILGGTSAISAGVESTLQGLGITTERLQGASRQLTAVAIAGAEQKVLGFGFGHVFLAVGNNFPDALAGGPIAGVLKAPILLTTDTNDLNAATQNFLMANNGAVSAVTAFGGPLAISNKVLSQAQASALCQPGAAAGGGGGLGGLLGSLLGGAAGPNIKAAAATTTVKPTTTAAPTTTVAPTTTATPTCSTTTTGTPTTVFSGSTTTAFTGSTTAAPVPGL